MYQITDNFLPPEDFNTIKEFLMSPYFDWYYNDYSISPDYINSDHVSIPQFIHNFIRIEGTQGGMSGSQFVDKLNPLFDRIENLSTIIRCKANLTMRQSENIASGMHVDTVRPFNGFTSILYLNDTDGGTEFENGEVVECKANRFVRFDNRIKHSAISCTDQTRRIVININYTVWDGEHD